MSLSVDIVGNDAVSYITLLEWALNKFKLSDWFYFVAAAATSSAFCKCQILNNLPDFGRFSVLTESYYTVK